MAFPRPPFRISQKTNTADVTLVRYLKDTANFSYLKSGTKRVIKKLEENDLRTQDKVLLKLWPKVLTDALRQLKWYDPREWDQEKDKKVDYGSFFHEGSLGVTELENVLKSFADFESMLYGASPDRYRDHIAHAFRVWIMGHGVLKDKRCLKGQLFSDGLFHGKKQKGGQEVPPGICAEEWECMWAIVALCHDLGYPLQHLDRINSLARDTLRQMGLVHSGDLRFSFSQQMLPFHESIIRLMASKPVRAGDRFCTHLQNKYYLKLLKSFDNLEHGIVSSLLISKALVYFLESDLSQDRSDTLNEQDARQFLIRREILRAIAAHTCQDIYHLRFDTLSFLLYIIDEIQCWGRPTLEELQHSSAERPEAEAELVVFKPNKVAVIIHTAEGKGSAKATDAQICKLHRMLRLGVDTAMLGGHELEFAIIPPKGNGKHLLLKDGAIKIKDVDCKHLVCKLKKPMK